MSGVDGPISVAIPSFRPRFMLNRPAADSRVRQHASQYCRRRTPVPSSHARLSAIRYFPSSVRVRRSFDSGGRCPGASFQVEPVRVSRRLLLALLDAERGAAIEPHRTLTSVGSHGQHARNRSGGESSQERLTLREVVLARVGVEPLSALLQALFKDGYLETAQATSLATAACARATSRARPCRRR